MGQRWDKGGTKVGQTEDRCKGGTKVGQRWDRGETKVGQTSDRRGTEIKV
mgnify:CR=1 FL=1